MIQYLIMRSMWLCKASVISIDSQINKRLTQPINDPLHTLGNINAASR